MRIRLSYYTDPDPGHGNSPYESKSGSGNFPYGTDPRKQIQSQFFSPKFTQIFVLLVHWYIFAHT